MCLIFLPLFSVCQHSRLCCSCLHLIISTLLQFSCFKFCLREITSNLKSRQEQNTEHMATVTVDARDAHASPPVKEFTTLGIIAAADTLCVCMSIEWLLLISCGLPVGCKQCVSQQEAPLNTSNSQRPLHGKHGAQTPPVIKSAHTARAHGLMCVCVCCLYTMKTRMHNK